MRDFSILKQRILQYIEKKNVSKYEFYQKTGISNGILSQKNGLSEENIMKFLSYYSDVNADWLLNGKGQMMKAKYDQNDDVTYVGEPGQLIKTPIKSRVKKLPNQPGLINFYDVDFAAGDVEFFDDANTIKPAYTMDIPEFSGCTAFRTYNNSMEKLIYSGDILFATEEKDWRESLEYGQIYGIVCHNRRKYLKYIRKHDGKDETHFLLKSENSKEYDDFTLKKESIKSIWLIHGWLKKRVG